MTRTDLHRASFRTSLLPVFLHVRRTANSFASCCEPESEQPISIVTLVVLSPCGKTRTALAASAWCVASHLTDSRVSPCGRSYSFASAPCTFFHRLHVGHSKVVYAVCVASRPHVGHPCHSTAPHAMCVTSVPTKAILAPKKE